MGSSGYDMTEVGEFVLFCAAVCFIGGAIFGTGHPVAAVVQVLATGTLGLLFLERIVIPGLQQYGWLFLTIPIAALAGMGTGSAIAHRWPQVKG
jgi:hypothetical protein